MIEHRKLIVLDLDNTLWAGVIGDEDVEPLVGFQTALKALKDRGMLLAIASKNSERIGLAGFKHPKMVLQLEDFVAHRINWNDKASNINDMVKELNIGLDSVVFIDDSTFQQGRVREALPEVLVPDWHGQDWVVGSRAGIPKKDWHTITLENWDQVSIAALAKLEHLFDASLTEEDKQRTQMYARERERAISRSKSASLEDWLATLGTKIDVRKLVDEDLPRTVQLLNKTNQMNLSTRRFDDEAAFMRWVNEAAAEVFTFRVSDRFGDAGLSGVMSLRMDDDAIVRIVDFVLSCRVMGRLVEEAMVAHAVERAQERRGLQLHAELVPTAKNAPCAEFWSKRSGFKRDGNLFTMEVVVANDAVWEGSLD